MQFNDTTYWLKNARVPASLLAEVPENADRTREDLVMVDVEVREGAIGQIVASSQNPETENLLGLNLRGGQLWPCFVDLHTHLDKGHVWDRSPNPDGSFNGAIETCDRDASQYWNAEDIYRRMEFGLKCSYAHGTKAIRTHLDYLGKHLPDSWEVFTILREEWQDKILLQGVSLVLIDRFGTPEGEKLADRLAEIGGIMGGMPQMNADLDKQLDRVFSLAMERSLDLDFHTDESGNPEAMTVRHVAAAALRHQFSGKIICGHCCSLAVQSPEEVKQTLELVREAGIAIVSLPTCNLYLQDRQPGRTPRWRGVTLLQEIKAAGIPVALASDNCRDPFYGFGDRDMLEVFTMAVRIGHLDMPYGDWPNAVTSTPADLMRLPEVGKIEEGGPADLILFKGRTYSELLSRHQGDRLVWRRGKAIDRTLPDYDQLDDLTARSECTNN
ncbi:MAG: cytosine deaminase [Hormoscilla sp. GM102CHS1]|nr:cytosine deaminase [Hormoscilla sp. GM102CHS1]